MFKSNIFKMLTIMSILIISNMYCAPKKAKTEEHIPIATQWLLDAAGKTGRSAIKSVYLIRCTKSTKKGTGFLLKSGQIITNKHVVSGCLVADIFALPSVGGKVLFSKLSTDSTRDLAILFPQKKLYGGLELSGSSEKLNIGAAVSTWGYPLGYNGPAPLLSVGYLSGFLAKLKNKRLIRHLVVNGAFNSGNSGGPLLKINDNKVIGIVVSKHAPLSKLHHSALKALEENNAGAVFTYTDNKGNKKKVFESQIVADLLLTYRKNLTQVMLGEAISVSELRAFLIEQGIK